MKVTLSLSDVRSICSYQRIIRFFELESDALRTLPSNRCWVTPFGGWQTPLPAVTSHTRNAKAAPGTTEEWLGFAKSHRCTSCVFPYGGGPIPNSLQA
jgi:hypothetical protein